MIYFFFQGRGDDCSFLCGPILPDSLFSSSVFHLFSFRRLGAGAKRFAGCCISKTCCWLLFRSCALLLSFSAVRPLPDFSSVPELIVSHALPLCSSVFVTYSDFPILRRISPFFSISPSLLYARLVVASSAFFPWRHSLFLRYSSWNSINRTFSFPL